MENKPKKKRYSRQQIKKRVDGKCFVCKETQYEILDAHRIVEGGTYHPVNVVTLCSNCHRKVHSGEIKFDRKYTSTLGKTIIHWWKNGEEFWSSED